MKRKGFPVSMAALWGMVFTQAMHSVTLGISMGMLMGITFGLFDSGRRGNKDDNHSASTQKCRLPVGAAFFPPLMDDLKSGHLYATRFFTDTVRQIGREPITPCPFPFSP